MERGREGEFPKFLSKPVETKRVAREERRRRAVNNWQRRAVLAMAGDGGDKLEGHLPCTGRRIRLYSPQFPRSIGDRARNADRGKS